MSRNRIFESNSPLALAVSNPTTPAAGDPVRWGVKAGVAEDAKNTVSGLTTVSFTGVYTLSVKGTTGSNSAVAVGDALYYVDADTPKVSKTTSGVLIGHAMEAVTSGATATIRVRLAG
jgi:hypothetical protein